MRLHISLDGKDRLNRDQPYSHATISTGLILCNPVIFVNNQLDAQFFFIYVFSILYMFRAAMCPSSGELITPIHLVYATLYRWPFCRRVWMRLLCSLIQTCIPNGHIYRVTYTRCHFDTTLLMMGTWLPETCTE